MEESEVEDGGQTMGGARDEEAETNVDRGLCHVVSLLSLVQNANIPRDRVHFRTNTPKYHGLCK